MKKVLLTLMMLLLLAGTSFAQLGSYFTNISEDLKQEAAPFKESTIIVGGTVPAAFTSIFAAFEPGYCGPDQFTLSAEWISMTVIAVLVVAFGLTIIWMLGQILQSPNLIATAKDEAFQAILTILRVVFIGLVILSLNSWFVAKTAGANADEVYKLGGKPIDAAMSFSRLLIVEMVTDYSNLVMYNMVLHTLYSSTMWFGVTWRAMYSFNLGPVLKPLIDAVGSALQFLSLGIGEWMLHLVMLCLIKKWTWSLFIPVGIFLRTFPQTRGAGEALFAIIFALAVIYPFMFLVTYETHKIMSNNIVDGTSALTSFVRESGILKVTGAVVATMFLAAGVFFPFFIGMALNIAIELIQNAIYYVVVMSLLLPFLNIFITLTAAKEIARFFSVDVSFMSFIKVI